MMENRKKEKSKEVNIDLNNPEFNNAWDLLENTDRSVFMTGKAGTGKSTFLRYITSQTKKKFVVLAPTGIAAVNVGGQTLHSFFKIPLKPLLPDDPDFAISRLRQRLKYSKSHIKLIQSLDLIIIDEISMVRADVVDFIDRVLRIYCGKMQLPFGGKQLLLVGDVFQLEPVVRGEDKDVLSRAYSSYFFFDAKVFNQIELVPIELVKMYRQEEAAFINILDKVRMGNPDENDLGVLNSRFVPDESARAEETKELTMTIATRREMVDSINERHLKELKTPSVIFEGIIERDFPESSLPTDKNLELKVGAQIVFVKNDPEHRWVNGTLAVVDSVSPDELRVKTESGEIVDVEPNIWSNIKYVYNEDERKVEEIDLGSFTQYPVKLAWALTIHKSQGLTFNNVIIDLGRGAFTGGQTYVALSRCRSLEGIRLLNRISHRDIFVKPEIRKFASKFNDNKLIETAISNSKADSYFAAASRAWNRMSTDEAVDYFIEAISLKPEVIANERIARFLKMKMNVISRQRTRIAELEKVIRSDREGFENLAAQRVAIADEIVSDGWDMEAAMAQYDGALEICPGYGPALLGKASVLTGLGRTDEAEAIYDAYAGTNSADSWKAMLGLGTIREASGDVFGAADSYLKANLAFPNLKQPLERLVSLYASIGDVDQVRYYKKILDKMKRRKGTTPG